MVLLDGWVRLADKFIELTRERERQRDKLYEKIVKPMFECMQEVHVDYLRMLHTTRQTLESSQSSVEGFKHFETQRLELQGMRHDILSRSHDLLHIQNMSECREFLEAVNQYLSGGMTTAVTFSGTERLIQEWMRETMSAAGDYYDAQSRYARALRRQERSGETSTPIEPPKRLEIDVSKIESVLRSPATLSRLQHCIDKEIDNYQDRWRVVSSANTKWLAKIVSF